MLDFRIQTFLEVCKYQNYTKAAKSLHITQPAVSQHIKYLENLFGVKLFYCSERQVYLTKPGEKLLEKATLLQNDVNYLAKQLQMIEYEQKEIYFGVTKTIGEYSIGKQLAKYIREHKDTYIRLIIANTTELLNKIEKGELQFALVEGNFPEEQYCSMIFRQVDFIAVCGKDYVFDKEPENVVDLLKETLLLREEGSGTRKILEKNLAAHNIEIQNFNSTLQIESMHLIVELLKENIGISFLYRDAVKKELEQGVIREIKLKDFNVKHDFTFIWLKDSVFSEEYKEICKEFYE